MKTQYWLICLLIYSPVLVAQGLADRLAKATAILQADPQMKHALLGLSVLKTESGEKVWEINSQIGMAPASCQKIITSAAAMEMLGPKYRFQTELGYSGQIEGNTLQGNLYIIGNGDPSLGSWRYDSTKEEIVLQNWVNILKMNGIKKINGQIIGIDGKWEKETLPGGWIWDDIGNYYGAGTSALNWRENQYDVFLHSGHEIGAKVTILYSKPEPYQSTLESEVIAAAKETGDNAYIYLPPFSHRGFIRGTIPIDQTSFKISGSFPDPSLQLISAFANQLDSEKIGYNRFFSSAGKELPEIKALYTQFSPTLDSLNYWFLKKSINLYGETLVKAIAYEKTGIGSTDKGVLLLKEFWNQKGVEPASINIIDGSGLSPQNRVTTDALVHVLQFAKSRPWFSYFYDALPLFNQMKLKSGTIGGTKSFAGYHTAKDGIKYIVAIIVNNFDGSSSEIVKKMFRILDELK